MSDLVLEEMHAEAIVDIIDAEEKGYLRLGGADGSKRWSYSVTLTAEGAKAVAAGDVQMMALVTGMGLVGPNGEDATHLLERGAYAFKQAFS